MMESRAAAYTASLPVSIVEHMKAYHDAFVNTGEINTTLLRIADGVIGKLGQRIPDLIVEPALIHRLRSEIVNLGAELESCARRHQNRIPN